MECPKCEEGKLRKIRFLANKKIPYLCDMCASFWYVGEPVDVSTGHSLAGQEQSNHPAFVFIRKKDLDSQEAQDEIEREKYE